MAELEGRAKRWVADYLDQEGKRHNLIGTQIGTQHHNTRRYMAERLPYPKTLRAVQTLTFRYVVV
jgi:hypothetical protein